MVGVYGRRVRATLRAEFTGGVTGGVYGRRRLLGKGGDILATSTRQASTRRGQSTVSVSA